MRDFITMASVSTPGGVQLKGPVTYNGEDYLFVNHETSHDIYFRLKKEDGHWHFNGGPSVEIPDDMIQQVGAQIEQSLGR